MLESLLEILDAFRVLDLIQIDNFRSVYIKQDFSILLVVLNCLIPEWIDHDNVFAWLKDRITMQKGESELASKLPIDKLTALCHENDIEATRDKYLIWVLLLIITQAIALL